jgi:Kinesin motor domain.
MEGPEIEGGTARDVLGESRGMIARAVDQIFSSISKLKEKEWNFVMESSFLEVFL